MPKRIVKVPCIIARMNYRIISYLLLVLLLAACVPNSSAVYPTYDPFVPVSDETSTSESIHVQPTASPARPTPTRAPISVKIPTRISNSPIGAPTPDAPHPLPPPREYVDQHAIQYGDTLESVAKKYGVTLEVLMQANGLNEMSILTIGQTINIPPVQIDPAPGSSFKLIPDSELVYGPASVGFDLEAFAERKGGYLGGYAQDVGGAYLSGAQIIMRVAQNYSVNPRLLTAILEYRSGWVTNPAPLNTDYPMGYHDDYYAGLYRQAAWAADNLNRGYYLWRAHALGALPLNDGTYAPMDATINAGTAGVQYFFSLFNNRNVWDYDVSQLGFFQTYNLLFGYPFDYDVSPLVPANLTQPALQLPFEHGTIWSFTGGPHGGWDNGSAWAALDFAPPGGGAGCSPNEAWDVSVADGLIVRAENGAVVQDLDNDGYEQTGWTILYMHVESRDRVPPGTYLYAGDRIGHPSCEGGLSNATHLHLARRYNGEWIAADGNLPFNLDGWVSSGNGVVYNGWLTRDAVVLQAEEGVFEGVNQISR